MDPDVKFRWRQRPPKSNDPMHKRTAAKLRRTVVAALPYRPWCKQMRVAVRDEDLSSNNDESKLAMWVLFPSAVDAFWAASLMQSIHRAIVTTNPQISRIAISSPKAPATGYAPLISWRFGASDYRLRSIRESETQAFVRHLNWCASTACKELRHSGGTKLLQCSSLSQGLQWEATSAFVHFAAEQGFLTCPAEYALRTLTETDRAKQPVWACARGLTRWKALKTLVDHGVLVDFVGRQRPIRPHGSTPTLQEILSFVAAAFNLSPSDLTGGDRRAHVMHARQCAAGVMRRATSRSLMEIGECLGGRDHATVINSLERIEKWRRLDPMHSWLVESFAQVADNVGLLKTHDFRQKAQRQLEKGFQSLNESVSPGPKGTNSIQLSRNGNVITVPFESINKWQNGG